jgi:mannose-1-phosphate guanylyltransferase
MIVDNIIILAAGKGTRMGEIGKDLPKVLWPLLDKTLLEWQVLYAKSLFPNAKIHINLFNYKTKILDFMRENEESFKNINILEEKEELDVGGAIHNLAKTLGYKGKLLILNGDQFLFFSNKLDLIQINENENLMMAYDVNTSMGYNALKVESDYLQGVINNSELKPNTAIVTYTGMSIIELTALLPTSGKSKFFETVISSNLSKTKVEILNELEYWDFGTYERYIDSVAKLLSQKGSKFELFLKKNTSTLEEAQKKYQENRAITFGPLLIENRSVKKPL